MLPKLLQLIKKYGLWVALVVILLVPQLRLPIQIHLNQAFSLINWVTIENDVKAANLDEMVLIAEDGTEIRGGELKNKVIFINLWATWCPPCIAEMPSIQKLHSNYKEEVIFLMVSNEPFEKTNRFKEAKGFDFLVYRPKSIPKAIYGKSIPKTLIIDSKGNIKIEKTGAVNWNSNKIKTLLDELLDEPI